MLKPGTLLRSRRKFKILYHMNYGGFSDLYLAKYTANNRRVVVKVLKNTEFSSYEEEEAYWLRERAFIDIQSKFSQQSLQLIDSFIDNNNPNNPLFVLITTLISGKDFNEWFQEYSQNEHIFNPNYYRNMIKSVLIPICDYFVYIHGHGLLHLDFSPSNIIMKCSKNKIIPVVIDWGASLNFDPARLNKIPPNLDDLEEDEGFHIYTPGYCPPEIIMNKKVIPQSDIYSFGAIMYYVFTKGVEPEEKEESDNFELEPKKINSECPEGLNQIVKLCTQNEPKKRFISFIMIKESLLTFLKVNKLIN